MDQLELPLTHSAPSPTVVAYLTIAEAAVLVRCCERTIRRAIDNRELRAGRVHGAQGSRGGFRIRPADLDAWMYGDGS